MADKERKFGFLNRLIMMLNHLAVIALLLAYTARYVSPAVQCIFAFFGLLYPYLLVVNILFIFYWIARRRKQFLYSLIMILCGWSLLTSYVQLAFNDEGASDFGKRFKIMSYNVKLFDLYNWNDNLNTRNAFFDLIQHQDADILCFQEFYSSDGGALDNLDTLIQLQRAKNYHVTYTSTLRKTDHWGGAIFSSFPILAKGAIKLSTSNTNNNLAMYADLLVNGDTLRVYNIHLQSINFNKQDYKFVEELINKQNTEDLKQSKGIFNRLKFAYQNRAHQAELIRKHIEKSPYSVFVCGDFNDTPASYAYATLVEGLTDSFMESGVGFGRTYVGKVPSFRIDYILHSKDYNGVEFQTVEKQLSDHYPITCEYVKVK